MRTARGRVGKNAQRIIKKLSKTILVAAAKMRYNIDIQFGKEIAAMAKAAQVVLLENEYYLIKAPNGKVLEVKNFNTENGAAIRL